MCLKYQNKNIHKIRALQDISYTKVKNILKARDMKVGVLNLYTLESRVFWEHKGSLQVSIERKYHLDVNEKHYTIEHIVFMHFIMLVYAFMYIIYVLHAFESLEVTRQYQAY